MITVQTYDIVSVQGTDGRDVLDSVRVGDLITLETVDDDVIYGRVEQLGRSLGRVMTVWIDPR